jgi:hypothetical protein
MVAFLTPKRTVEGAPGFARSFVDRCDRLPSVFSQRLRLKMVLHGTTNGDCFVHDLLFPEP